MVRGAGVAFDFGQILDETWNKSTYPSHSALIKKAAPLSQLHKSLITASTLILAHATRQSESGMQRLISSSRTTADVLFLARGTRQSKSGTGEAAIGSISNKCRFFSGSQADFQYVSQGAIQLSLTGTFKPKFGPNTSGPRRIQLRRGKISSEGVVPEDLGLGYICIQRLSYIRYTKYRKTAPSAAIDCMARSRQRSFECVCLLS